jgi:hypothetical protein
VPALATDTAGLCWIWRHEPILKPVAIGGIEFHPVPRGTHVEWCSPDWRIAAGRSAGHPTFYARCDGTKLPFPFGTLDRALKEALNCLSRASDSAAHTWRYARHR